MDSNVEYSNKEELEEEFEVVDGIVYVQDFNSLGRVKICV